MKSYRENPEGEENHKATKANALEVSRLQKIEDIKAAHVEQEKDELEIQKDS